jgi:hypothetical protein
MRWARHAYIIFVAKPEGKIPLRKPRRRWEDNIRTDLKEIEWEGVDWVHMAQDRNKWRAAAICYFRGKRENSVKRNLRFQASSRAQ